MSDNNPVSGIATKTPYKVGLTGGIASGKSTASELFSRLGTPVIDADQIARELVAPGSPLLERIAHELGNRFIDSQGRLDRFQLRTHIFSNPDAKKRLESILHPPIEKELIKRAESSEAPYVLLVIPLMVETKMERLVDRVVVVDIPEELQRQRLCQREGISESMAERIMANQATRRERLAVAHDLLDNSKDLRHLSSQVEQLHALYLTLSEGESH